MVKWHCLYKCCINFVGSKGEFGMSLSYLPTFSGNYRIGGQQCDTDTTTVQLPKITNLLYSGVGI